MTSPHALILDGVYASSNPFTAPTFRRVARTTDAEVASLQRLSRERGNERVRAVSEHESRLGGTRNPSQSVARDKDLQSRAST